MISRVTNRLQHETLGSVWGPLHSWSITQLAVTGLPCHVKAEAQRRGSSSAWEGFLKISVHAAVLTSEIGNKKKEMGEYSGEERPKNHPLPAM